MRKIKEFKSYISILLILTLLFTSNSGLMAYEENNIIDVGGLQTSNIEDETLDGYDSYDNESIEDFKINIDWADSKFKNGSELKILEESDTSNSVKLRVNYGNQKVNEKGYKPGELIIAVKGIGAINRSGAIEALVGADKVGSGTQNRDWSYTWNKSNDMYTFTNNNEIKANSVVSGYFDMIWNIKSRDSIHGYSQNDVQANMILLDGSNIESNILSIENNTKCDKYSIDIERELLYSGNGVSGELDVDEYTFIKYSLTSYINKASRGVSGDEKFIFDPDTDDRSEECLVVHQLQRVL